MNLKKLMAKKISDSLSSFKVTNISVEPKWIYETGKQTIWIYCFINGIQVAFPFTAKRGGDMFFSGVDCDECVLVTQKAFWQSKPEGKRITHIAEGGGRTYYALEISDKVLKSMPKENQKSFSFTGRYYSTKPLIQAFKQKIIELYNNNLLTEEFLSAINYIR